MTGSSKAHAVLLFLLLIIPVSLILATMSSSDEWSHPGNYTDNWYYDICSIPGGALVYWVQYTDKESVIRFQILDGQGEPVGDRIDHREEGRDICSPSLAYVNGSLLMVYLVTVDPWEEARSNDPVLMELVFLELDPENLVMKKGTQKRIISRMFNGGEKLEIFVSNDSFYIIQKIDDDRKKMSYLPVGNFRTMDSLALSWSTWSDRFKLDNFGGIPDNIIYHIGDEGIDILLFETSGYCMQYAVGNGTPTLEDPWAGIGIVTLRTPDENNTFFQYIQISDRLYGYLSYTTWTLNIFNDRIFWEATRTEEGFFLISQTESWPEESPAIYFLPWNQNISYIHPFDIVLEYPHGRGQVDDGNGRATAYWIGDIPDSDEYDYVILISYDLTWPISNESIAISESGVTYPRVVYSDDNIPLLLAKESEPGRNLRVFRIEGEITERTHHAGRESGSMVYYVIFIVFSLGILMVLAMGMTIDTETLRYFRNYKRETLEIFSVSDLRKPFGLEAEGKTKEELIDMILAPVKKRGPTQKELHRISVYKPFSRLLLVLLLFTLITTVTIPFMFLFRSFSPGLTAGFNVNLVLSGYMILSVIALFIMRKEIKGPGEGRYFMYMFSPIAAGTVFLTILLSQVLFRSVSTGNFFNAAILIIPDLLVLSMAVPVHVLLRSSRRKKVKVLPYLFILIPVVNAIIILYSFFNTDLYLQPYNVGGIFASTAFFRLGMLTILVIASVAVINNELGPYDLKPMNEWKADIYKKERKVSLILGLLVIIPIVILPFIEFKFLPEGDPLDVLIMGGMGSFVSILGFVFFKVYAKKEKLQQSAGSPGSSNATIILIMPVMIVLGSMLISISLGFFFAVPLIILGIVLFYKGNSMLKEVEEEIRDKRIGNEKEDEIEKKKIGTKEKRKRIFVTSRMFRDRARSTQLSLLLMSVFFSLGGPGIAVARNEFIDIQFELPEHLVLIGLLFFSGLITGLSIFAIFGIKKIRKAETILDMIRGNHIVPMGTLGMFSCWGLGALTSDVLIVCSGTFVYLLLYVVITRIDLQAQYMRFNEFTRDERMLLPGEAVFLRQSMMESMNNTQENGSRQD